MDTNTTSDDVDLKEQLANYERIIEISRQLNSTLEHKALLKQIISAVLEIVRTEAASILLIDPTSGELRFEISSNMNTNTMEEIIVPMEGSIAGWIATHGEPRVIQDVTVEPGHFHAVDETIEFRTQNLLGVPMRTHKKVIGVLEAVNKLNGHQFTEQDVSTLVILASQAAIAIENARMFRQSDFIAEMVHELRTPLAALKASTTLLFRPDLAADKHDEIVHLVQSETDRLIRLTTEFLDLARLESGRARLEIAPFDLNKLIAESADVISQQAAEKDIEVIIEGEQVTVDGDRGKVKQVLLNLFTNAVKYNRPTGRIRILTELHDDDMVQIAVEDTGFGISRENQKQMFQKFFRVADTAGYTSGTGLGLAIAKHIIEAHGGEVWLESEEGVGSTFFVTLPVTQ